MRQLLFCLSLAVTVLLVHACTYKVLKADKYLAKNQLAKAKKKIDKAIEKDSDNPAALFMLAKYYSHPVWSYNAVDSSHLYIMMVEDTFPNLPAETLAELASKGLDSVEIAQQSIVIDSLAFEKALSVNTEAAYNQYLNNYQYLIFEEKATELRNQVAYSNAIAANTTQAVSDFFRKYPNAPQAQKARNVFETLFYEKKTASGLLSDYIEYLDERPETEFAKEAANTILSLISAGAEKEDFRRFINRYAQFEAAKTAIALLDGLDYEEQQSVLLTHKRDSTHYLYNLKKQELLPYQLQNLKTDSCSFITKPFILSTEGEETQAYLKSGEKLSDMNIQSIQHLGNGFFKLKDYSRQYILKHHSLKKGLEQQAVDFKLLDDYHIAKIEDDGWHLISVLGEEILRDAVDSIWTEKSLFFFKKGNDVAVSSRSEFRKTATQDFKSLSFLYGDFEWLDDQYLRLYSNDYETILDNSGRVIFPLEKAKYDFFDNFWVKEKGEVISVFDNNTIPLFDEEFDEFKYKSGILALKKDSLWSVYLNELNQFPKFEYDSVRIFNSWLAYAQKDSSRYLLFKDGAKLEIDQQQVFKILKNYNVALSDISDQIRFVELSNQKSDVQLYNAKGRKIGEGKNLDVNVLTPSLVQVHIDKKKELIDSTGNVIDLRNVKAFGAYKDGLIPILKGKGFGALIVENFKIILPISESKLEVFLKDSLYIFKEDKLMGISDAAGEIVVEADFENIYYFNDSTAIVEEEGDFGILNIYQNTYIEDGFDSWEQIMFKNTSYYKLRKEAGYGVLNSEGKEIIPFIFNELNSFKDGQEMYWLAERRLSEINYLVIAYFNESGKVLFKEGLNFDDYLETACD